MTDSAIFIQRQGATDPPIIDVGMVACRVQEARLLAALLESGWALKAREAHWKALRGISDICPLERLECISGVVHTLPITIDHPLPKTTCGPVTKPLVFPEWMFNENITDICQRPLLCSFVGFPNQKRVVDALALCQKSFGSVSWVKKKTLLVLSAYTGVDAVISIINYLFRLLAKPHRCCFVWTHAGRQVDHKVYDETYWTVLSQSQTVYCPAGDFGWSYRFYEAIVAGAMPIVDASADSAFAKRFATARSIPTHQELFHLKSLTEMNRLTALRLITAREELRPHNLLASMPSSECLY